MIYKYQRFNDIPRELVDRCRLLAASEMRKSLNRGLVYEIIGHIPPSVGKGIRLAAKASRDRKLLEWVLLTITDENLPHRLQAYVRATHRRQGVGTELVFSLQNDIRYGDKIEVLGEDAVARSFWKSIGYPHLVINP